MDDEIVYHGERVASSAVEDMFLVYGDVQRVISHVISSAKGWDLFCWNKEFYVDNESQSRERDLDSECAISLKSASYAHHSGSCAQMQRGTESKGAVIRMLLLILDHGSSIWKCVNSDYIERFIFGSMLY